MALQGTLESFGISEIFQLVSQQGKTGTLEIDTGEGVARIRFLSGRIVEAWPDKRASSELIGAMLVRGGLLTRAQVDHALGLQRQSLRPLGDLLVRTGAVRIFDFKAMLELQHRETVYKLLTRKKGRFSFRDEPVEVEEGVSVLLDTGALLMEGFRQIDEWPALRAALRDETKVLVKLREPEGELTSDQARVLPLVDGVAIVREVADRSRLGEFSAWKALASLAAAGVVAPLSADKTRGAPAARREERTFGVADALAASVLVLLSLALLFQGGAVGFATRVAEGVSSAHAEAAGVQRFYLPWAERRPLLRPGGMLDR